MATIDEFDHQTGVHCGAAAIRNLTRHYGWQYSEAASFGIGGGPAFVQYADPDGAFERYRTAPIWLERAFFERVGIPHLHRSGDDVETALDDVAARIDDEDPVLVFLDPASLPYLTDEKAHVPPHVAVVVGVEDNTVILSDAAVPERQEISTVNFQRAWSHDRFFSMQNEYLVVTRAAKTEDGTDAVAAGLRQAAQYMLEPLQIKRNARGPGEEGIVALRDFADALGTWSDWDDAVERVEFARRAIDEHGDGTAFRNLFADSLTVLGRRVDLPPDIADRTSRVAREWETAATRLDDILAEDGDRAATFEEAASLLGSIADREAAVFEDIASHLGKRE